MPIPTLFLSYCHADKALVDSLRGALEARTVATWTDREKLFLGGDLASLEATLKGCDGVVQVVSAAALNDYRRAEKSFITFHRLCPLVGRFLMSMFEHISANCACSSRNRLRSRVQPLDSLMCPLQLSLHANALILV